MLCKILQPLMTETLLKDLVLKTKNMGNQDSMNGKIIAERLSVRQLIILRRTLECMSPIALNDSGSSQEHQLYHT